MTLSMNEFTDTDIPTYFSSSTMPIIKQSLVEFLYEQTYDEILSRVIENWMKNHVVSHITRNTVKLQCPNLCTWNDIKKIRLTFSGGDTTLQFTISIEQDN